MGRVFSEGFPLDIRQGLSRRIDMARYRPENYIVVVCDGSYQWVGSDVASRPELRPNYVLRKCVGVWTRRGRPIARDGRAPS